MTNTIETYRGAVFPWECDWNGHMNVRFYVGKFDEGTWQFMAQIGASREELKRRNCGAMAVSQTITSVNALGTTSCRFRHVMIEMASGEVAAEMELVGVFVELATRKPMPLWPEARAKAEALLERAEPVEKAA